MELEKTKTPYPGTEKSCHCYLQGRFIKFFHYIIYDHKSSLNHMKNVVILSGLNVVYLFQDKNGYKYLYKFKFSYD